MAVQKIHEILNRKFQKERNVIEREVYQVQGKFEQLNNSLINSRKSFNNANRNKKNQIEKQVQLILSKFYEKNLLLEQAYTNDELLKQIASFQAYLGDSYFTNKKKLNLIANAIQNQESRVLGFIKRNKLDLSVDFGFLANVCNELTKDFLCLKSGANAEADTERIVATFDHKVKRLCNNRICAHETQNQKKIFAENDMVIICENGIFTLEIKNSSTDLVVTKNGDLISKYSNNGEKRQNIAEQSLLHVNITQRVIGEELVKRYPNKKIEEVPVTPLIIIANNSIQVKDDFKRFPILLKSEIQEYVLEKHTPKKKLSQKEIDLYYDILKKRDEGPAKFLLKLDMKEFYKQLAVFIWVQQQLNDSKADLFDHNRHQEEINKLTEKLDIEKKNLDLVDKRLNEFDEKMGKFNKAFDVLYKLETLLIQSFKELYKSKVIRWSVLIFILGHLALALSSITLDKLTESFSQKRNELSNSEYIVSPVSLTELSEDNIELEQTLVREEEKQTLLNNSLSLLESNEFMFTPGSEWTGTGLINENEVSVKLTVENLRVIYHVNENVSFSLIKQHLDEEIGFVNLKAMEWIEADGNYDMVDLVGLINGNTMLLLVRQNNENIGELKFTREN